MIPRPEEVTVLERGCTRCNPKLRHNDEHLSDRHVSAFLQDKGKLRHNGELVTSAREAETGAGGWALIDMTDTADCGAWGLEAFHSVLAHGCPDGQVGGIPAVLVASDGFTFEPTADDSTDPQ